MADIDSNMNNGARARVRQHIQVMRALIGVPAALSSSSFVNYQLYSYFDPEKKKIMKEMTDIIC